MLILSRKIDERIYVGDDIVITLVDIRGDKVRLGITAPPCLAVDREEVRVAKAMNQAIGAPAADKTS